MIVPDACPVLSTASWSGVEPGPVGGRGGRGTLLGPEGSGGPLPRCWWVPRCCGVGGAGFWVSFVGVCPGGWVSGLVDVLFVK